MGVAVVGVVRVEMAGKGEGCSGEVRGGVAEAEEVWEGEEG